MTLSETCHRDFYIALRKARKGEALRSCNRMVKRVAAVSAGLPSATTVQPASPAELLAA